MIRGYRTGDLDALREICIRTGADGGDATNLYEHPELLCRIWLDPYLAFDPAWAWVADDGTGPLGYVIAARDVAVFEDWCEREWWPEQRRAFPLDAFAPDSPDGRLVALLHHPHATPPPLAASHPAELHVDILPAGQGHGLGGRLIGTLLEALRADGAPGVHLGVSVTNQRAVGFYRKLGFTELFGNPWALTFGRAPV